MAPQLIERRFKRNKGPGLIPVYAPPPEGCRFNTLTEILEVVVPVLVRANCPLCRHHERTPARGFVANSESWEDSGMEVS